MAAAALLDEHPGGVWLVAARRRRRRPRRARRPSPPPIGAERDGARPPTRRSSARLRDRGPVLLVLDNLEHLLPAAPEIARAARRAAGRCACCATSQAPLRLGRRALPARSTPSTTTAALGADRARRAPPRRRRPGRRRRAARRRAPARRPAARARAGRRAPRAPVPAQLRDRLRASSDLLQDAAPRPPGAPPLAARHRGVDAGPARRRAARALHPPGRVRRARSSSPSSRPSPARDGLDVLEALAALLDVALVRRVETGDGRVRFGLPRRCARSPPSSSTPRPTATPGAARTSGARRTSPGRARRGQAAGADYRAALAADAEAAAALRWARAHDDPLAAPLAAARAGLLTYTGRVREAFALLEPAARRAVRATPSSTARACRRYGVRALPRRAHGRGAGRRRAGAVDRRGPDDARPGALLIRGLVHTLVATSTKPACATARRRRRSPASSSRRSSPACSPMEAQARLFAGEIERAAQLWRRPSASARRVDAVALWTVETWHGDLALQDGPPARRARALRALARGGAGARDARSRCGSTWSASPTPSPQLGEDAAALEVVGLAEARRGEMLGPEAPAIPHFPGFGDALARRRGAPRRRGGRRAQGARPRRAGRPARHPGVRARARVRRRGPGGRARRGRRRR